MKAKVFRLAFEGIVALAGLALGIGLMVFSSHRAGEHSISLAEALGASPFIIACMQGPIKLQASPKEIGKHAKSIK